MANNTTGWWLSHPSEKCESQMELLFPIYGKIERSKPTTSKIIQEYIISEKSKKKNFVFPRVNMGH